MDFPSSPFGALASPGRRQPQANNTTSASHAQALESFKSRLDNRLAGRSPTQKYSQAAERSPAAATLAEEHAPLAQPNSPTVSYPRQGRRDSFFDAVGPVYDTDEDEDEQNLLQQAQGEQQEPRIQNPLERQKHFYSRLRTALISFYKQHNPRIAAQFESGAHQQLLHELINGAGAFGFIAFHIHTSSFFSSSVALHSESRQKSEL